MQIVCPKCSTSYEVPDSVFGGRARKLRCEQCGHQWRGGPAEGAVEWSGPAAGLGGASPANPPPTSAGGAWPVDPSEPASQFLLSAEQRFGHAADRNAQADFENALTQETAEPQAEALPEPPAADTELDKVLAPDPGYGDDVNGGFADLITAARNKAIEFEPEPPPPPMVPVTGPVFFGILLVLFLLGVLILAHNQVEALIPPSAGLFKLLGL